VVNVLDKFLKRIFTFLSPAGGKMGTGSLRAGGFSGILYWLIVDAFGWEIVCGIMGIGRVLSEDMEGNR